MSIGGMAHRLHSVVRRHSRPIVIVSAFLAMVYAGNRCSAESGEPAPVASFRKFAETQVATLARVNSFEMTGVIRIVAADRFLKENPGPKAAESPFRVLGKGDTMVVFSSVFDGNGSSAPIVYYLNATQVIEVQKGRGGVAKIFTLGRAPNIGVFNVCPAFLEYGFLNGPIDYCGLQALRPAEVGSAAVWTSALKSLRTVSVEAGGHLLGSFATEKGSAVVDLLPSSAGAGGYRVGAVSFLNPERALDCKLEVLSTVDDKLVGTLGTAYRLSFYRDLPGKPPSVVWDYRVDTFKLNGPIDEEALAFDPSSVGLIYDGDAKTFINVPR